MRRILLSAGLLPHLLALNAQVHPLPVVEVSAQRIHLNAFGLMDYGPDSLLWHHRNLFEISGILQYALPATIRQYGPGLIATIRVRGLSSEHFKVIWNGLSLNNPALGLFDFSGVHATTFKQAQIFQGNAAGFYGSGSGGGVLLLSSQTSGKKFEVSTNTSAGSYGYRQYGLQSEFSLGKISAKINVNQHLARNDYTFTNLSLQPQRLLNGSYIHKNLNLDISHRLNNNQSIHLAVWNQSSFINIPPSRVESLFNTSRQWNDNLRSSITYTKESDQYNLIGGMGWTHERMVYHHDILQIEDTHYVKGIQGFVRGSANLRRGRILFNTEAGFADAPSIKRMADARQTNFLTNATYEGRLLNNLIYAVTLRQEWMNGEFSPPVAKLSGEWQRKFVSINVSAGNHFRWPTLNERYWVPGGNTNLAPEKGLTIDFGFKSDYIINGWYFKSGIQPFIQWIDQLILWQSGSGFWSPINIQSAQSQGVESIFEIKKSLVPNQFITIRVNYCFNRTLITDAASPLEISIGKQLIYSPLHSGGGLVGYTFKNWSILITSQFQSPQHTLYDNHTSGLIDGFAIFNAFIFKNIAFCKLKSKIGFEIRNIADAEYQMIAQRPMPGREFRLNVQFQYVKPKTHQL